jgi:hypothetical protein
MPKKPRSDTPPVTRSQVGDPVEWEHAFIRHLALTGDPVKAAEAAGIPDPIYGARAMLANPRVQHALARIEHASATEAALTANRITNRWLAAMEKKLAEDPEAAHTIPMRTVLAAAKNARETRDSIVARERAQTVAALNRAALQRLATKAGIDLDELTGRNLLPGEGDDK